MPKSDKENFSISINPEIMRRLQEVADLKFFGNRSIAAADAIQEYVDKEILKLRPSARNALYDFLKNESN